MPCLLLLVFIVTGVLWWKSLYIYPCPPHYLCPWKVKVLVAQLCPTLWDTMNCSPPGSSVHGIFQARILKCVAISHSRASSLPKILQSPSVHLFLKPSLVAQLVKNLPAMQETWVRSLVGKIPWRRERLPTPVFGPREFHGLYSP